MTRKGGKSQPKKSPQNNPVTNPEPKKSFSSLWLGLLIPILAFFIFKSFFAPPLYRVHLIVDSSTRYEQFVATNANLGHLANPSPPFDEQSLTVDSLLSSGAVSTMLARSPKFSIQPLLLALQHRAAWRRCIEEKTPLLVLESGMVVHPEIEAFVQENIMTLRSVSLVRFSANLNYGVFFERLPQQAEKIEWKKQPNTQLLNRTKIDDVRLYTLTKSVGTGAYFITPAGAHLLEKACFPLEENLLENFNAQVVNVILTHRMNSIGALFSQPFLAYHNDFFL